MRGPLADEPTNGVLPEAGFLAWIDCRDMGWSELAASVFLAKAGIAFSPGESFCGKHADFIRINFATSEPILRSMLMRMEEIAG